MSKRIIQSLGNYPPRDPEVSYTQEERIRIQELIAETPAGFRPVVEHEFEAGRSVIVELDVTLDLKFAKSPLPSEREEAIDALGNTYNTQVKPILIGALSDDDAAVRAVAVKHLSHYDGDDVEEALFTAMQDDNIGISQAAEQALFRMGSDKLKLKLDPKKWPKISQLSTSSDSQ